MEQHDPKTCPVCKELGDWLTTRDIDYWFLAHQDAGISLRAVPAPGGSPIIYKAKEVKA